MNETITIVIETGNAAFDDIGELSKILRKLADDGEMYCWATSDFIGEKLRDSNGNVVGEVFGKIKGAPSI